MSAQEIYNWLIDRAKNDGLIAVRAACKLYLKSGSRDGVIPTKRKPIPRQWVEQAYLRQRGFCARVKHPMTLDEATGDHRIPISEGGKHAKSNIAAMCRAHNSSKGAKLPIAESKSSGRTILEQLKGS